MDPKAFVVVVVWSVSGLHKKAVVVFVVVVVCRYRCVFFLFVDVFVDDDEWLGKHSCCEFLRWGNC